ncbi:T9SS type A sorting domain-containing protein [Alkalitalea saponilacus]|uniref:Por secretion system C-terminal sorting domain-containing protein n=1 Tax=Alkalitalea saponilacus TaxID=889453 RepID=A0A1T5HU82_9BACT|nr:T9SS type A sorting domain-containing protein [Alkalitalea saponilacus]SKC24236.1 Por secretion system C-terminal sorting domain-containing protein [Alkalitalea saponilacus]
MKRKVLVVLFLGIICHQFSAFSQLPKLATRAMSVNDPNTDPNWKWYENVTVQLYVEANQPPVNRKMPWFGNQGSAAIALNTGDNATRDMYPSDGWVLLYRDFGTPSIEQPWPHFILYNKFKGIVRLFFIDFRITPQSYYAITLSHKNPSITTSALASDSRDKGYLDSYSATHNQIAICKATLGEWAYVDFDFTTYDPNKPAGLGYAFEVKSVYQGHIDLFANKLSEVTEKNPTTFEAVNSVIKKSAASIALGKQYFSTPQGFLKDMTKLADDNKGKWFESTLREISGSTIANTIPIIGGVAGIITGFLGNDKGTVSSFTPFKITGDVKFDNLVRQFFIWAPGTPHNEPSGLGIPLYDKPLGIFGVRKINILETVHEDSYVNFRVSSFSINKLDFIINPNSNLKVTDIKFGVVPEGASTTYLNEREFLLKKHNTQPKSIAIFATLKSVCNLEREVFIIKSFSNFDVIRNYQPYPPFYNGPIPMFENNYLNTNFNIYSENDFYMGGDRGDFISNNSTGEIKAPTSIVLKPGTHIKGGNIKISLSYKSHHNDYILNNNFNCTDDLSNQYFLKSVEVSNLSEFISVNEVIQNSNIRIFPNPFEDILYIEPIELNSNTNLQIRIYSFDGKLVYDNFNANINHIQTAFLNSGLYIIAIMNNGEIIRREKIVKY